MKKIAIIPARGGSKRIPKKNVRDFLGRPMISFAIQSCIESGLFDEVMVSTDDEATAEIARSLGARVPFFRSAENSSDTAGTVDVLVEVIEAYQQQGIRFDLACCVYATNPLLSVNRLQEGLKKLQDSNFDSVFAAVKYSFPVQRSFVLNNDKMQLMFPEHLNSRSQDLAPVYHDAGQFYWFRPDLLLASKKIWTNNTGIVELSELEVQDIDEESDWKMAELKFKMLKG